MKMTVLPATIQMRPTSLSKWNTSCLTVHLLNLRQQRQSENIAYMVTQSLVTKKLHLDSVTNLRIEIF